MITLDSVYFQAGSRVQCAARAVNSNGDEGLELSSPIVTISQEEGKGRTLTGHLKINTFQGWPVVAIRNNMSNKTSDLNDVVMKSGGDIFYCNVSLEYCTSSKRPAFEFLLD